MKSFSIQEALVVGWQAFKERPVFIIGLFLLTTVISVLMGMFSDMAQTGIVSILINILDLSLQIILGIGLLLILLRVYDKVDTGYTDLLESLHLFWKYFFVTILAVIIVAVGLVVFVIPGIIAMLALTFAPYLVVDKNMHAIEAIKESVRLTNGHRWNLLIFAGVVFFINALGALALGIGLLVTIPITALAAIHVYRWLLNPQDKNAIIVSGWAKALVVVGLIIFLLGGIVFLATYRGSQYRNTGVRTAVNSESARDAQRKNDLAQIQLVLSMYYDGAGTYPLQLQNIVPQYIDVLPVDPLTRASYIYTPAASQKQYELCSLLENTAVNTFCVTQDTLGTRP